MTPHTISKLALIWHSNRILKNMSAVGSPWVKMPPECMCPYCVNASHVCVLISWIAKNNNDIFLLKKAALAVETIP